MAITKGIGKKRAETIVSDMVDRWKQWKGGGENGRQAKEETWDEIDRMIKCQFPDTTDVHQLRSQRYFPEAYKAWINFNSTATRAIMPSSNFFNASGTNRESEKHATLRTRFMRNRLEAGEFLMRFAYRFFPSLSEFGNCPYWINWNTLPSRHRRNADGSLKKYTYTEKQPVLGEDGRYVIMPDGKLKMERIKRTYTPGSNLYDGPSFMPLDLFNFVIDPTHPDQDGAIKIYRHFLPKSELRKLAEPTSSGYERYDRKVVSELLDESAPKESETSDSQAKDRSDRFGTNRVPSGGAFGSKHMVEMWFIHGDIPTPLGVLENHVVEIGNRRHLLRCEPSNIYCGRSPLRLATLIPMPGEIYGMGILENSRGLQDAINAFHNQLIDGAQFSLNPILKIKDNTITQGNDYRSFPGALWPVENMDDIEPMFSPIAQVLQGLAPLNNLERMLVDATSSHINFGATRASETATATAVAASLAESTTGFMVRNVEFELEMHILPSFDELEKQYWDDQAEDVFARFKDDTGTHYEPVTSETIYQNYEWKSRGSGTAQTKAMKIQELFQWGAAIAQTPGKFAADWEAAAKYALELMGFRNADELIPGVRAMAEKNPALLAQALLEGGGGSGAGVNQPSGLAPPGRGSIPNAGGSPQLMEAGRRGNR